jgi:hypothetical protein
MSIQFSFSKLSLAAVGAACAIGTCASAGHAASLGGYTFGTGAGDLLPSGVASGVTFSDFSYSGDGGTNFPSGNGAGKAYSVNGFSDDETIDNSPGDGYFAFTIAPTTGNKLTLDDLKFDVQPNGNDGPTSLFVRYSTDSFTSFTQVLNQTDITKNNWQTLTANLSGAMFTSPVAFRIYGYNTGPGKADNLDIDNVLVNGSTAKVPTPALLPGLLGLGAGILRKRKQQVAAA